MNVFTRAIVSVTLATVMTWTSPVSASSTPVMEKDPVDMVVIPAGTFVRGSAEGEGRPDERPRRKIFLDAFSIDKYEVSNARYFEFLKETLHKAPMNVYGDTPLMEEEGIETLPVVQVTWHDAVDYCFWAGKRLPTEAEWEKAARGDNPRLYPWGDNPPDAKKANFEKDWTNKQTLLDVRTLPDGQSPYGLFHVSGNVREWVQDWYDADYYDHAPEKNPKGPESGILKVVRGDPGEVLKPICGSHHGEKADLP
ncbi:MAG: SUMF1/EgtB/PvdO family nonheme iron enzyme [Nitrospirales bacterium]|nr:formylglycine-generating enzyme family protein [Nitrospirales bacterium]